MAPTSSKLSKKDSIAATAATAAAATSPFGTLDLVAMKRKYAEQAGNVMKSLKSSAGNSAGPRISCVVLKRMPPKPKSPNAKKPPPVRICVMVISPTVELKYMSEDGEKPKTMLVEIGSSLWIKVFEPSPVIVEGTTIVLQNPRASEYNGNTSITTGANLISEGATLKELVAAIPIDVLKLPTLETLTDQSNAILPFGLEKYRSAVHIFRFPFATADLNIREAFLRKNKDESAEIPPKIGAYLAAYKGFPLVYAGTGKQPVLLSMLFYDNHLKHFGMMNIDHWPYFAVRFLTCIRGFVFAYADEKGTRAMDINNRFEEPENANDETTFQYALRLKVSSVFLDMPSIIREIGLQVSPEYVKTFFKNELLLESMYSSENMYANKKFAAPVVNLCEYTGKLDTFFDESAWTLYSVVDYKPDDNIGEVNDADFCTIRDTLSTEQREQCILAVNDRSIVPPYAIDFSVEVIYAVRK